jgi:hypothetical protein
MLPFATLGREAIPFLRQLHHVLRRADCISLREDLVHFLPHLLAPRKASSIASSIPGPHVPATPSLCADRRQPTDTALRTFARKEQIAALISFRHPRLQILR